ncbi:MULTISPECIES: hypothetical protein [unclassified Delftia]|uniref:hypothetical protein n=1 Tax=unclassified Delftia TaxID=2613839 RepID=UPI001900C4B4|nr:MULTISPECIES: hypothetical protein [unclassified Delftia]MBK0110954.1 hypothetical protein [Delftia sp. S65]MBK0116296.1 hypothetical protein [Delftia sp. S67]MBK0129788.1 hypothetical protein [Delftia sp. S66]
MVNPTTAAFRKMMLNGRLNTLMNQGVQEGIAATASAREDRQTTADASAEARHKDIEQRRRFVQPEFFTPVDKPSRKQPTQAELDAEFAIPAHVLKKQDASDL